MNVSTISDKEEEKEIKIKSSSLKKASEQAGMGRRDITHTFLFRLADRCFFFRNKTERKNVGSKERRKEGKKERKKERKKKRCKEFVSG